MLKEVFERAFKVGQSQCALLLGGRNKNTSVVIAETAESYSATVLELSGLLCRNDLQALQCIALQLAQIAEVAYEETHFSGTLRFIRKNLAPGQKIVLAVYDIQEFAYKNLKQVLLYSLFELVHEENCMICVIGVTNHLDFVELLEKRIKSRFTYQSILMLDTEILENLVEGLEIEDFNLKVIKQLKQLHMVVLAAYIKTAVKRLEISLVSAFKEFQLFKSNSPMIVYDLDKFTFSIITNYLIKSDLLKTTKKHVISRFSTFALTFDPESLIYSVKRGTVEVPTSIEEWLLNTN